MNPLAMAVALALAQEAPLAALATVEIVATAPLAGLGIDRKLLPYTLQSATGERMAAAHSGNLAGFMARNLNGVNVNDISGSPFQNDITYRGFRASPVLGSSQGISVYLDGVRVNEPFGDVVNWDMLPEAAVGKLLLVPGSNPVYGLNTLGGALALSTRSGVSHPGLALDLSAGSGARKRFDFARGSRNEQGWHSFIASTLFDENGWRQHSQGRLANVFIKLGHDAGGAAWSVSLLGGRSRLRGNGLLPDAMYREDRSAAYTFPDETRNRLLQLAFNASVQLDGGTELSALAYARNSRRDTVNGDVEDDGDGPEGVFNTTSTRQEGLDASANLAVSALSLRASYSYLDAAYDANGVLFTGVRTVPIVRGTRIAGLPAHTLKLDADWRLSDSLTLGADMQAVSRMPTQGNEDGFMVDTQRADLRVRGHALLNLRAGWEPAAHWEVYARVSNVFDRRHETYGAVARNLFSGEGNARFVAPGAPRTLAVGLRYSY